MCKFRILVSDDLSYATLRVENVSIKHYQYEKDITKELFNRFKHDIPTIIEFGSENAITKSLRTFINRIGYNIMPDGKVIEIKKKDICFNTIEKEIGESLSLFEIKVKDVLHYHELCKILLMEGYSISTTQKDDIFIVSVY